MTTVTVRQADWQRDFEQLRYIREKVFVEEQSVPLDLEWDNQDTSAYHWLAFTADNQAVGTARMLRDGHIGRMAVLKTHRHQGIGQLLLSAVLEAGAEHSLPSVYLHAQCHALGFYQRMGFESVGDTFMDAGIPHCKMVRAIQINRLLGIHGGDFAIHDLSATLLSLVSQCERKLSIVSPDLTPHLFDNDAMLTTLSVLARRSRYTEIRILVTNPKSIVKRGHGVINLARRLSSTLKIRRTDAEPKELPNAFVIADQIGVLFYPITLQSEGKVWANFNNKPIAMATQAEFDKLWERGIDDHELRALEI